MNQVLGPRVSPCDDRISWRVAGLISSGSIRDIEDAKILFRRSGGLALAYRDALTDTLTLENFD